MLRCFFGQVLPEACGFRDNHGLPGKNTPFLEIRRESDGLLESGLFQQFSPARRREQCVRRPQLMVGKPPPPLRQSKYQIDESERSRPLEQYQQAAWSQELLYMAQTLAQIPGGVQNIGRQNQVVAVGIQSLNEGSLFDVQKLVAHKRVIGELLLRPGGKRT